ncbi:MFS transporter [Streptomyces liangshanensis]|uniref:MFS transporter n=1 Tax=Streptomyces liangshanensis TaxID=2717324 RepID=A0A6G9GSM5_9ACTN|nr:MFS transporter [Streptomyces liangshanensis]QIQ01252.1 MFS transporter [Streptomyces liangshanensis]
MSDRDTSPVGATVEAGVAPDPPRSHAPVTPVARPRGLILVLALACGIAVANIYYAQPLVTPIAAAFGVSEGRTALAITLGQIGYALGLALLLPLGDLVENRRLVPRMLLVTALAALAAGLSPGFGPFLAAAVVLGMTSVVAQILIAFVANTSSAGERGAVVGNVMTGLLLGILLARTVSSLVAAAWGWRAIYLISAGLLAALAVVLARILPRRGPSSGGSYPALLASIVRLAREESVLRRRAITQALVFGAFSAFWTSVAVQLDHREHLGQVGIGLFALVGAAGAIGAPVAGRLGDRGLGRSASGIALALAAVSMVLAGIWAGNLVLLAVAAVLLDIAVQCHIVLSQREIYTLRPDARARVTTVFMTTVFVGGATGSGLSGLAYDERGWSGVTVLGTAMASLGFAIWAVAALRGRPSR